MQEGFTATLIANALVGCAVTGDFVGFLRTWRFGNPKADFAVIKDAYKRAREKFVPKQEVFVPF